MLFEERSRVLTTKSPLEIEFRKRSTETNLAMLQKLLPALLEKPQTLPVEMHAKIFGKEAEGLSDGQAVDRYINNLELPDEVKKVIKSSPFAEGLRNYNDNLLTAAGAILPGLMGEYEHEGKREKLDGISLSSDAARISERLELISQRSDAANNLLTKATALMAAYDRNSMVTTLVTEVGTKIPITTQGTPRDLIGKILGSGEHALQVPGENRTLTPLTDAAGLSVSSKMELAHVVLALELGKINFKGDTELFASIKPSLPMTEVAETYANARAAEEERHADMIAAASAGAGAGVRDDDYDNTLPGHASGGASSFSAATPEVTEHMREALGGAGDGGVHDDSVGSRRVRRNVKPVIESQEPTTVQNAGNAARARAAAELERRRLEEHGASSHTSAAPHSQAPTSPKNGKASPGLG